MRGKKEEEASFTVETAPCPVVHKSSSKRKGPGTGNQHDSTLRARMMRLRSYGDVQKNGSMD
jgi:hypothetical protein